MAASRFLIAGIVMLSAVAIVRRGALIRPTRPQLRDCFIVGALLMGGGMGAVAWGEQTVPSGIAALLIAMMPVWVAIFGRVFLHERLPLAATLGIGDRDGRSRDPRRPVDRARRRRSIQRASSRC